MAVHLLATNALAVLPFRVLSASWPGPKLSDETAGQRPAQNEHASCDGVLVVLPPASFPALYCKAIEEHQSLSPTHVFV